MMSEMEKALRLGLAKVLEQCPRHCLLTGIFSAPKGGGFSFEFAVVGEKKLLLRMGMPQEEFLKVSIPALVSDFDEHHGMKPAFIMEWLLDEGVIQQGVRALADEIARQIVEE